MERDDWRRPPTAEEVNLLTVVNNLEGIATRDPHHGIAEYTTLLNRAEHIGAQSLASQLISFIGICYLSLGQLDEAITQHTKALTLAREIGHHYAILTALINLTAVYVPKGDLVQALRCAQQALEESNTTEDNPENLSARVRAFSNIAVVYHKLGNVDKYMAYLQESLQVARGLKTSAEGALLVNLAAALIDRGHYEEAQRYCEQALQSFSDFDRPSDVGHCHGVMADIHIRLGNGILAIDHATKALNIHRSLEIKIYEANVLLRLADAHHLIGNLDEAIEYYDESIKVASSLAKGNATYECDALCGLAAIAEQKGQTTEAIAYLQRGVERLQQGGLPEESLRIYNALYAAYKRNGQYTEALAAFEIYHDLQQALHTKESDARLQNIIIERDLASAQRDAELHRLRAEQLTLQLERKQQELASQAMHLARQTELLGHFRNDLRAIVRESTSTDPTLRKIREKLKELPCESIDWTKFDAEFRSTYPEFQSKLLQRWPTLTGTELKVCSLLKLRLTSVDIGKLLCVSERSVESHRYNIRRKMDLSRGEDLHQVLAGI